MRKAAQVLEHTYVYLETPRIPLLLRNTILLDGFLCCKNNIATSSFCLLTPMELILGPTTAIYFAF